MSDEIMTTANTDSSDKTNTRKLQGLHTSSSSSSPDSQSVPASLLYFCFSVAHWGTVLASNMAMTLACLWPPCWCHISFKKKRKKTNTLDFCPRSEIPRSGRIVIISSGQCNGQEGSGLNKVEIVPDSWLAAGKKASQPVEEWWITPNCEMQSDLEAWNWRLRTC